MITLKDIKEDKEVKTIMYMSEKQIEALGFTEHSVRHSSIVSKWSGEILKAIGCAERRVQLAEIAGYLHDIGNVVCRVDHAQSGSLIAYNLLAKMGMDFQEAAEVMMAIGNHDESVGLPVSDISAALIIADKSDVHKSRVRKNITRSSVKSIHDKVNLAAERSFLSYDNPDEIDLNITIDTSFVSVMDYFEIYFGRMQLCRRAAEFLGKKFSLIINDVKLV